MTAADAVEEVWLNPAAKEIQDIGQSIRAGDVIVKVSNIASEDELKALLDAGKRAKQEASEARGRAANGRHRFPVADPAAFPYDVVLRCEEIMLRVLDRVDDTMPTVYETLFKPCEEWAERQPRNAQGLQPTVAPPLHLADAFPTLRDLYMAGELEWSEGEPAINVYSANGRFGAHKDHLALTVLIPLTSTATFTGGGTGFWAGGRSVDEDPWKPPDEVLKPPLGTALVFGGDVTHAGMPVEAGLRSVFVASFSTRTEASAEDRVQGLQGPPPVSAAFSGSDEADEDNVGLPPPPQDLLLPLQSIPTLAREVPLSPTPSSAASPPPATPSTAAAGVLSAKERLRELNELKDMGLVTQSEYDRKRAEILATI